MNRITQVFFGNDCLPYKDSARQVHYPITGISFAGSNNVNKIFFYVRDIGGVNTLSWVANVKLPNGKILYQLLTNIQLDERLGEYYLVFDLSSYYTQLKGDIYISLNGCKGQVELETDSETDITTISGTIESSTVVATGCIKFSINYAPQRPNGYSFEIDELQEIINALSNKSNVISTIQVVVDIDDEDLSGYENGQLIYSLYQGLYYKVDSNEEDGYELANGNGLLGNKGALVRFLDLTDSITLQEIYNMLGYMRYGVLNVDGLDYLVTMSDNHHIVAYDLYNKQLFDYNAVAEDTFYDVIDAQPIKFVQHVYSANKLYGTNESAQDTALSYGTNVINNGIPQRESSGQIRVPTTPTQSYHAASKSYIDANYGKKVELSIDENYDLVIKLLNNYDSVISQADVDLPLESIVVSAQYYDTYTYQGTTYTKVLVIELATTDDPIIVPIGDLVSGLVSETTFNIAVAQLQTNINKCVQQTNTANVVYGTNGVGNQTNIEYGIGVLPYGLVRRDALGQINVSATPSSNSNATSKQYVDTFGRTLEFSIDNSTYVMTFKLKDNNGNVISTQTIDLPLETMVVDGSYDDTTESLILELKNGQTIAIPISDLISGLVTNTSLATTLTNYYTKAQIDQMVAGFVFADVDDYLSDSSTNPVENRVITNALETKANTQDLVDGQIVVGKALTTQQIENVSEESGVIQETPFINQGTSTSNNTEETPTAPVAKQLEKQGNSVVVNSQVQNGNFASTSGWSTGTGTLSASNNVLTFNPDTFTNSVAVSGNLLISIVGHKYLLSCDFKYNNKLPSSNPFIGFGGYEGINGTITSLNTWTNVRGIVERTNNLGTNLASIYPRCNGWENGDSVSFRNFICVDLTQHFGSNDAIPQDLLDHPEHWSWYDNTNGAYNTGSLDNSTGRYLVCTGRQQWDEKWEVGTIDSSNGQNYESSSTIRSKNYSRVIPDTNYYVKATKTLRVYMYDANKNYLGYQDKLNATLSIPNNCVYIRFIVYGSGYGTTYNHDITISVYYTTGDGYDEYYPYVAPKVYDTGVETLRSAGNVKDYKTPDGTIHRLVGSVDLGSLNWSYWGSQGLFYAVLSDKKPLRSSVCSCALYLYKSYVPTWDSMGNMELTSGDSDNTIYIRNNAYTDAAAFKTAMSGVYLFYELSTPTTEQGTPFPENIEVDDYGTMYWLDTNNELVGIPQGTKLFYPADYVLLMDDLNIYVNGDISKLALKTDLTASLTASESARDSVDAQLKNAIGGTLRQLVATSKNIDFNNTDWVDLGNLEYTKYGGSYPNLFLSTSLANVIKKPVSSNEKGNIICVIYQTDTYLNVGTTGYTNNFISVSQNGTISINNPSYTDVTEFKNAMKNVLLAYEKAS